MNFELITLNTTYLEAELVKNLLSELYIVPRPILSISVHTNSRSIIEILKQENANKKMNRHIQIELKSVQRLFGKVVILNFIKSEKILADPLTKDHFRSVVLKLSREKGLSS